MKHGNSNIKPVQPAVFNKNNIVLVFNYGIDCIFGSMKKENNSLVIK
jgi:hypothetical protein